jgi:E3 ubiquitin-protein ligase TRAF7
MLPTKFITPASPALHCPMCENLFTDPVISTRCGHTFCRMCITENISSRGNVSNSVCPVDNIPFHRADLVSNIALKGQIEDLEIHCQHGLDRVDSDDEFHLDEEGCPQAIKLGRRVEHEEKCPYALVPCPNSANHCGKFRRRDLDGHLETCPRYPCKYRNEGKGSAPPPQPTRDWSWEVQVWGCWHIGYPITDLFCHGGEASNK